MTDLEIAQAGLAEAEGVDDESLIAVSSEEPTEAEREATASRIAELERELLAAEAALVHEIDTSAHPDDPEQPAPAPALDEAAVAAVPVLTARRIIARALSKRDYSEAGKDDSVFGRWYGLNPAAWCAMFVSWVFYVEGMPIPAHTRKGFAYCGHGVKWFKNQNRWRGPSTTPKPGWVVFYDWGHTSEPFDHVGIVHSVNRDGSINAIEGNTMNPQTGRDRPRGVHLRSRRVGILGYGEPRFVPAPSQQSNLPPQFKLLKRNASGALVRRMQGLLRAADPTLTDAKLEISGTFDDATLSEVKRFQQSHGLSVDGEVGPNTWRALLGLRR